MRKRMLIVVLLAAGIGGVLWFRGQDLTSAVVSAYDDSLAYPPLAIVYPYDEAVFPPEIPAPQFRWKNTCEADAWLIIFKFAAGTPLSFVSRSPYWTPSEEQWQQIKRRSVERSAKVTVIGVQAAAPSRILAGGSIAIATSADEVGAPVFYREVILPFAAAVSDPYRIKWRFGPISAETQPPVVLEGLPVCGNCHSFSRDGKTLAMDVDYASDKGSYAIADISPQIKLAKDNIITWSAYRREDKKATFGLLSQISPDGRHVVSTVKDWSVFAATPDFAFSQLFFPVQGILVVYTRKTGMFTALPGADDPQFVQSNPVWSPDGKQLVFARSKMHRLKVQRRKEAVLTPEECREFLIEHRPFKYDLYRLPFNEGQGGTPQPLQGASDNGTSNYFPKFSPDGKWIVFCRAKNYMLLQPDSELYIVPAEGGEARRLRCNTRRMNSWHSWSPNGKWLIFSSKAYSAYTQLFLSHIDAEGNATPPVVLDRFTAGDRAANIPEFINTTPDAIDRITFDEP